MKSTKIILKEETCQAGEYSYQLGEPAPRRYNLWHRSIKGHPEFPPLSSLTNPEHPIGQAMCTWLANQISGWTNWPLQNFPLASHVHHVHQISQPDLRNKQKIHMWKSALVHSLSVTKTLEIFKHWDFASLFKKVLDLVFIHSNHHYGFKSSLRSILRDRGGPYFALLRSGSLHHGEKNPDLSAAPEG